MDEVSVKRILVQDLKFTDSDIKKLEIYAESLLIFNQKYNLISRNTEKDVWNRHILDCAQLVKYINFEEPNSLADLGSGAGLPGIILAIFSKNENFHVKLYEKSPVKVKFLMDIAQKINLSTEILDGDCSLRNIESNFIVCRAFKKLDNLLKISRETIKKPHKMIILKGKNAQSELNKVSNKSKLNYKLKDSITDNKSKIIIIDALKSETNNYISN
jgi:16S rRNA (guanine527-N7)-methyltransferase|tara:strand:+ start:798 stop:1445 length:648 start_codon:yes stop_codon:yes gene_type:complete